MEEKVHIQDSTITTYVPMPENGDAVCWRDFHLSR